MPIDYERNFKKHEKYIAQFVMERKTTYFNSQCFQILNRRYRRLRNSSDNKFAVDSGHSSNQWKSKLGIPLVKERIMFRRATLKANHRQDPLMSVEPIGDTPLDNAMNIQETLTTNFKHTKYRRKVLSPMANFVATYGSGVTFTDFVQDIKFAYKTVDTPLGPKRDYVPISLSQNSMNYFVHILNYFQDPNKMDPDDSGYQGHIERWPMSRLVKKMEDDNYLKGNLKSVISEARSSAVNDTNYHDENRNDESKTDVDVVRGFFQLPLKGNEEDDSNYYIEWVGDTIIRIQAAIYDEDIRTYSHFRIEPRSDYWWGNTDAEFVVSHENWLTLFANITADNALRSGQNFKYVKKNALNRSSWANRHRNGGYIDINLKSGEKIDDVLQHRQFTDQSNPNMDFIVNHVLASAQRLTPKPDLNRPRASGGADPTATEINFLAGNQDILESDFLEEYSYGIQDNGKINTILLQQFLPDRFRIRPDVRQPQIELNKRDILGSFNYIIKSSMQKNKILEATRLQNALTQIINLVNTGRPEFQSVNTVKIFKEFVRNLDIGDVDEILPENAQVQQPGPGIPGQPQPDQPANQIPPEFRLAA